jgi:hypothetical protein
MEKIATGGASAVKEKGGKMIWSVFFKKNRMS